jgi:hypothetical protein
VTIVTIVTIVIVPSMEDGQKTGKSNAHRMMGSIMEKLGIEPRTFST